MFKIYFLATTVLITSCSKDPYEHAIKKGTTRLVKSRNYLHKAISIDSTKYQAYLLMGMDFLSENPDSSIYYLEKGIDRDRSVSDLWYLLAKAYEKKSGASFGDMYDDTMSAEIDTALLFFSKAISLDLNNSIYYYERARVRSFKFGRSNETLSDFYKSCQLSKSNSVPCMVYNKEKLFFD